MTVMDHGRCSATGTGPLLSNLPGWQLRRLPTQRAERALAPLWVGREVAGVMEKGFLPLPGCLPRLSLAA